MMYALRWNVKADDKYQYAMENPVVVTDRICKAALFTELAEAEKFKENNKLECFSIVSIDDAKVMEDMKEVLTEMKDQALRDFRKAVCNAKAAGLEKEELYHLVDTVNYVGR